MTDHRYLAASDVDTLASLVMELASQLHVERTRRMALEHVLVARGLVAADAVDAAPVADEAGKALDGSIRALLRIMAEGGDAKAPLRGEAVR